MPKPPETDWPEWDLWPRDDVWSETNLGMPAINDRLLHDLQVSYEGQIAAIKDCKSIDELRVNAEKAAAVARCAAKLNDKTVKFHAHRVHAWNVRRLGELLTEIPADVGGRPRKGQEYQDGDEKMSQRKRVAEQHGITLYQYHQALLIERIPLELFEAALARPKPPTLEQLADIARGRDESARHARAICTKLDNIISVVEEHSLLPHQVASAIFPHHKDAARLERALEYCARVLADINELREPPGVMQVKAILRENYDTNVQFNEHEKYVELVLQAAVYFGRAYTYFGNDIPKLVEWISMNKINRTQTDTHAFGMRSIGLLTAAKLQALLGMWLDLPLSRKHLEADKDFDFVEVWQKKVRPLAGDAAPPEAFQRPKEAPTAPPNDQAA